MQRKQLLGGIVVGGMMLTACGGGSSGDSGGAASIADAVITYADGVHSSYEASARSATEMAAMIEAFVADPTDATLDTARQSWLDARDDYGPTEAFRFYGGPIDDEATGPEGLINAWPMDEAYVDYVEGEPEAGIINDPATYPTIDGELLESLNENGGETNIATGWHAIEFLLWGQDLNDDGPGDRPASDYIDAPNADRRAQYLTTATALLVGHLDDLTAAWAPDTADNYRAEFLAMDPKEAMTLIITGIGELSRGELAGERMNVAYVNRSQEDEHSCFSDNTTADIVNNAKGIQMVLTAAYPGGAAGTSVLDVIAGTDADLATELASQVAASVAAVKAIPAPFDQHLRVDVADSDAGRASILAGITALETQTPTIVSAAEALGLSINVT